MDSDALAARIQDQLGSSAPGGDAPRQARPPPRIPDHELIACIGGGSYGDVWLARSVTGRLHAAKVVWRHNFSSDRPYEREFHGIVQFEPISRSHPGVVDVLHVGRDDEAGCFFYVMELADAAGPRSNGVMEKWSSGQTRSQQDSPAPTGHPSDSYAPRTLTSELKSRGRLPVAEVLTLGVQLSDALGHIHRHGLVHRDVKPSNIIFVEGQAKLADIGLVAGADEARSFVGTEGFIPPEGPGTVRADLFGLGRLLYEAGTGKDRCEFPELPADLDRWPDRVAMLELNEILARACAPEAKHRHANAAELAGDLNLLLAGRSVRRAYGIEHRLRRATHVTIVAGVTVLLAVGAVWFQQTQRKRADARATQQTALRQRAEQAEQQSRERLRESLLQQARAYTASTEADRRARALVALKQAGEIRPALDLRNAAAMALATPELRVIRRWNALGSNTKDSFNAYPNTTLSHYLLCYRDGTLAVLRMEDDTELFRLPRVAGMVDIALFSPDGKWLAVKYSDESLWVWNLVSRTSLRVVDRIYRAAFAFSRDSQWLAAVANDGTLRLVNPQTGRERWRVSGMADRESVAFHPHEQLLLATATDATKLDFVRLTDGVIARTAAVPLLGKVSRWSADGQRLITTHADYSIRIWDWPELGAPQVISRFHKSEPIYLATDPSGRWLASSGWDNRVHWLDSIAGESLLIQAGGRVHAAANEAKFLWAGKFEWTLGEFDPAFVPETIPMHQEGKGPRHLTFSPNGAWLATAGPDGIRLLDWRTREVSELPVAREPRAISFSVDGHKLYAMANEGMMGWELRREVPSGGVQFEPLKLPVSLARAEMMIPAFGPDRRRWVAARRNAGTALWRWRMGWMDEPNDTLRDVFTDSMNGPELSSNGRWLGWGNWLSRDAHVLDLQKTNVQPVSVSHPNHPTEQSSVLRFIHEGSASVAFSPDNRWFVVSDPAASWFFETGSWQLIYKVPRVPTGGVPSSVAFTSDSRLCAITIPPNQVRLTDPTDGNELITLQTPERHMLDRLAFSPDDRAVAVVSSDHNVLIWDLAKLRAKLRELGLDWPDPAITASR